MISKKNNLEVNLLDAVLTSDWCRQTHLRNDAHLENFENELTSKKNGDSKVRSEPTSVTILNILGGKKLRKIMYEGLRVLLDTGCSDSLVRAAYAKIGAEKK